MQICINEFIVFYYVYFRHIMEHFSIKPNYVVSIITFGVRSKVILSSFNRDYYNSYYPLKVKISCVFNYSVC